MGADGLPPNDIKRDTRPKKQVRDDQRPRKNAVGWPSRKRDIAEQKAAKMRGEMVLAADVAGEWSAFLRTVRAGMLAVPSRCAARLPHLSEHDVAEIDAEVRAALLELARKAQM